MVTMDKIKLGNVYNFSTIAPTILGASFKNMSCIAILGYDQARTFSDLATIHEQIKSTTNIILPINAKDCTYVLFQHPDKTRTVFALEYLLTLEEVKISKLVITVNNCVENSYHIIKSALENIGYRDIKMEMITTDSETVK